MRLNSKMTWGLAWTGLAVVLAVPSVDFLTGRLGGDAAAVLTSDIEPVKTASVTPADPLPAKTVTTVKTRNGISIVPAGSKPPAADALPSYISDGPSTADTQVATIDPTPPTPFPAWARPKVAAGPVAPVVEPAGPEPVVIVDDTLTGSIAAPADPALSGPMVDDSANWDTETLRQYLERRGILDGDADRSTATVTERSTNYDPDGFYLSDGPNGDRSVRETRRQRILRMLEESGDEPDSLTLF
jgi:hypothetical protein